MLLENTVHLFAGKTLTPSAPGARIQLAERHRVHVSGSRDVHYGVGRGRGVLRRRLRDACGGGGSRREAVGDCRALQLRGLARQHREPDGTGARAEPAPLPQVFALNP